MIGLGCDQADSPGDGLRQHLQDVQGFFRKMRANLPDLVIENCASGGHRLEPSFMGLTSMASFSDVHETRDIPVITANLHRLILPRQSQIWAVLHASDALERLVYFLTGGFLGLLCLSGEITTLDPRQWSLVLEAIQFYQQVAPVIAHGRSRLFQYINPSWQHLQGAQAVLRLAKDEQSTLIVTHSFGAPFPAEIHIPLPGSGWQVADRFPLPVPAPVIMDSRLRYVPSKEWQGAGIYLTH